jgi:hypothetical protein
MKGHPGKTNIYRGNFRSGLFKLEEVGSSRVYVELVEISAPWHDA